MNDIRFSWSYARDKYEQKGIKSIMKNYFVFRIQGDSDVIEPEENSLPILRKKP